MSLIVSGGHTLLVQVSGLKAYRILGRTLDDAAGEAFDKVAKMLGLEYPGGPEIERRARTGDPTAFRFSSDMLDSRDHNFSFSGLKTAVRYLLAKLSAARARRRPAIDDICARFSVRHRSAGQENDGGGEELPDRPRHVERGREL